MQIPKAVSAITKRLEPSKRDRIEKAISVTAGTAAAIWVVLRLRRELYGPGGTKLSSYDRAVDEKWEAARRAARESR